MWQSYDVCYNVGCDVNLVCDGVGISVVCLGCDTIMFIMWRLCYWSTVAANDVCMTYVVCCSCRWHYRAMSRSQRAASELSTTPRHRRCLATGRRRWRHTVVTRSSAWAPSRHTSVSVYHWRPRRPSAPTLVRPWTQPPHPRCHSDTHQYQCTTDGHADLQHRPWYDLELSLLTLAVTQTHISISVPLSVPRRPSAPTLVRPW